MARNMCKTNQFPPQKSEHSTQTNEPLASTTTSCKSCDSTLLFDTLNAKIEQELNVEQADFDLPPFKQLKRT